MAASRARKKVSAVRRDKDIESALRVLDIETKGLQALARSLDSSFTRAIETIHQMKEGHAGRLIVAGIGKSGHIARKIASTLASTGTPAYYVHPGEASHGDLGIITQDDVVLLISYSGESAELSDLIHFTRRFGIKLIAMTAKAKSQLGSHADILLQLPDIPEACPNGLAPTTSTTMALALGDAIAIALLERSGLTAQGFKKFHPGGKLGKQLLGTADVMRPFAKLPLIDEKAKMSEALILLTEKNLGCVLVVGKNKHDLKGIITDGDLKRHMAPDLLQKPVTAIMSRKPTTISADTLAVEAVNVMTKTPGRYMTSLIVVDASKKLTGLIRLQDCLQAGVA